MFAAGDLISRLGLFRPICTNLTHTARAFVLFYFPTRPEKLLHVVAKLDCYTVFIIVESPL